MSGRSGSSCRFRILLTKFAKILASLVKLAVPDVAALSAFDPA